MGSASTIVHFPWITLVVEKAKISLRLSSSLTLSHFYIFFSPKHYLEFIFQCWAFFSSHTEKTDKRGKLVSPVRPGCGPSDQVSFSRCSANPG